MQPIPQSNTRQNKRARKLNSSRLWRIKRSRVSSQSPTGWSPQHILYRKKTTHWVANQTINFEKTHKDNDGVRCDNDRIWHFHRLIGNPTNSDCHQWLNQVTREPPHENMRTRDDHPPCLTWIHQHTQPTAPCTDQSKILIKNPATDALSRRCGIL